jgi:hypothetical protein
VAFCTLLEFGDTFDLDRYAEMAERGGHGELPAGCLTRIVGKDEQRTGVIEVWDTGDDARRFGEPSAGLLAEFAMPPPTTVAAFETAIYESRSGGSQTPDLLRRLHVDVRERGLGGRGATVGIGREEPAG